MRLLLDQNLSRRLVSLRCAQLPASSHLVLLGLDKATDREVWERAGRTASSAFVAKDSDFGRLAFLYGAPPRVIWLCVGNQPTAGVARASLPLAEVCVPAGRSGPSRLRWLRGVE